MSAAAAESQRAILITFDLVQGVKNAISGVAGDYVIFPMRITIDFWIEASDSKRDIHALKGFIRAHQYFRSIGW